MTATIERGEELFAQGRLEDARVCFAEVLQSRPDDYQALNDLAVVSLALGDDRAAEDYFIRALETDGDHLEARVNLADFLVGRKRLAEAAPHLEKVLARMPDNVSVIAKLSRSYLGAGRPEDARALVESSRAVSLMKRLVDAAWTAVNYWELEGDLSTRERLEGLAATFFAILDGLAGPNIPFKLLVEDPGGDLAILRDLGEMFRYQYEESAAVKRLLMEQKDDRTGVLRMEWADDWEFFRERLRKEIKEEGGCLGDLTQSKKVLRREPRLKKYNVGKTLDYFRDNLGPCDCHVHRSIPV